ncbi:MAG: LL-diaminopimelate aminotransferase [Kiritimatiellae bacterium]|jgi:LL-diaminopimelate aminotransferase|nr:LL-diaminopimelate aminotransferase [Kiritimatiellia bacterium]
MATRNKNIAKLQAGYLFPEINRRKNALLEKEPNANIISLGIGDTTEPIPEFVAKAIADAAIGMATLDGYSGYGSGLGMTELREKITERLYNGRIGADEVCVSDGAKCDCGRLQVLFGADATIAVQDPAYPVYVDGSVIIGATGEYSAENKNFKNIAYMPCKPENNFFPDLANTPKTDLIYFCSPNNPTGATASKEQLEELVAFAKKNKSIIIFDSAYATFIQDPNTPKSIFEIEGAKEVAMEVSSFSKPAGFTGVRLGWTVVPKELKFEDGSSVLTDWKRIMSTVFNGASNIIQKGGIACLEDEGWSVVEERISFYMENARLIREALQELGITVYGGDNAPYIWAHFPGKNSWDVFEDILESCHVVSTPGAGFGATGNEFVRFSAFGHRDNVLEAIERLKKKLQE